MNDRLEPVKEKVLSAKEEFEIDECRKLLGLPPMDRRTEKKCLKCGTKFKGSKSNRLCDRHRKTALNDSWSGIS